MLRLAVAVAREWASLRYVGASHRPFATAEQLGGDSASHSIISKNQP